MLKQTLFLANHENGIESFKGKEMQLELQIAHNPVIEHVIKKPRKTYYESEEELRKALLRRRDSRHQITDFL